MNASKPDSSPSLDRLFAAAQAAQSFRELCVQPGEAADLDQAIARWEALAADPDFAAAPADFRASVLNETGMTFALRHRQGGRAADLDRAIELYQTAVTLTPPTSPRRGPRFNNLGTGHLRRYQLAKQADDLWEARECFRSALGVTSPRDPAAALALLNLGRTFVQEWEQAKNPDLLENAVEAFERGIGSLPAEAPERMSALLELAEAAVDWFRLRRQPAILERARAALGRIGRVSPEEAGAAAGLATAGRLWVDVYRLQGERADLDAGIVLLRSARAQAGGEAELQLTLAAALGGALRERFSLTGQLRDSDEAIVCLREAAVLPGYPGSRLARQAEFAEALVERFEQDGQEAGLAEALAVLREALRAAEPPAEERPGLLTGLAYVLVLRFQREGMEAPLDEAVALCLESLALGPAAGAATARTLNTLGLALNERYAGSGRIEDLDSALAAWTRALELAETDRERAALLTNTGVAHRARFVRTRETEDVERAVATIQQAVTLTPLDSPSRPWRLDNLGNALADRYHRLHRPADLGASLAALREAAATAPADAPERGKLLSNLALGLRDQFAAAGRVEDLDEAVSCLQEALARIPPEAARRGGLFLNLGSALKDRYSSRHEAGDLAAAQTAYAAAASQNIEAAPELVVTTARVWAEWAMERAEYPEAVRAAGYGRAALQVLVERQARRSHKQEWLRAAQGLGAIAALALVNAGDAAGAVEVLEQSRAYLLSEELERNRSDLERLPALGYRELFDRYKEAQTQLRQSDGFSAAERTDRLRALAAGDGAESCRLRLHQAIAEIRLVPGYEDFLLAPTLAQIRSAAACPLVYLAATAFGGLALVVRSCAAAPGEEGVTPVLLPSLTLAALHEKLFVENGGGLIGAYAGRDPAVPETRQRWLDLLDTTAEWLWGAVMGPVLEALLAALALPLAGPGGPAPAAVLIPSGLLGLLPLHAAWCRDPASPIGRRYALDDVAWRYAPNARVLGFARARAAAPATSENLLLVVDPRPVSAAPLPFVRDEALAVLRHWPEEARTSRWLHAATHEQLAELLPQCRYLHYAGHAFAGWDHPLNGGLLLAGDRVLGLQELQAMRLQTRLAVLSACETGVPGVAVPDEVIGLPAALVEAGVGGVVASLWTVPDFATSQLMAQFYARWRDPNEPLAPPEALRRAQLDLRDTGDTHLHDWAAFTFTGV